MAEQLAPMTLSPVDAAWLHMEEPENPMVITGLMWFETEVDWNGLERVIEERLLTPYPKFRMRIADRTFGGPRWVRDDAFTLEAHITRMCPEAPMAHDDLQGFVSQRMGELLDLSLAPWHMYFVDNVQGGAAVVFRLHHAIADGISLARVLFALTDEQPAVAGETKGVKAASPSPPSKSAVSYRAWRAARAMPGGLVRGLMALGKLLFGRADEHTCLRGPLSRSKRVAWSQTISLTNVKRLGKADGTTVNDVLLAAVSGALGRYLRERGTPARMVRAIVPVNLRRLDKPVPATLGNKFGLVFLPLPVGLRERGQRLAELKRCMDRIKRSPEAILAFVLLSIIGMMPAGVEHMLVKLFGKKASAIMTNVPGPRSSVYLAGAEVAGVLCWVPQSARLGLGVSILSYRGGVVVGIASDAALVPDPERIVRGVEEEIAIACAELESQRSSASSQSQSSSDAQTINLSLSS